MNELVAKMSVNLLRLDPIHRATLQWFFDNNGRVVAWSELAVGTTRLACAPKGIYKPEWSVYALSVKQTLGTKYPDGAPKRNADGGWTYIYHEETPPHGSSRDWFTNRGLDLCMDHGIPIGVLIQTEVKPAVRYRVMGLGLVTSFLDGFYSIDGLYSEVVGVDCGPTLTQPKFRLVAEDSDSYTF